MKKIAPPPKRRERRVFTTTPLIAHSEQLIALIVALSNHLGNSGRWFHQ
jgi:hypothetical protein